MRSNRTLGSQAGRGLSMTSLRVRAGSLVVLEGLDRSGKSTQRKRLQQLDWDHAPEFTHMPSGLTNLTSKIYGLTEREPITSPLARQLLHLACHAENQLALKTARQRGVVLDRWWWSTVAYGWHGGHLADTGLSAEVFFGLIDSVWKGHVADVVFLFMSPFEKDELNRDAVRQGYEILAAQHPEVVVRVPVATPAETTDFLREEMHARGLLNR